MRYLSYVFYIAFLVLTSAIFQFFMSYFASLLFVYWDLGSTVFHFCIFYFVFVVPAYWICRISVLYILLCFFRLWILTSAVLQFCIFSLAFFRCAYWRLQYFNFLNFTLLSSSLLIHSRSISVLYILLYFTRVCILTSAVLQFCIFYFALIFCAF